MYKKRDKKAIQERVKAIMDEELAVAKATYAEQSAEEQAAPVPEFVDVYSNNRKAIAEERNTPRPKGSPSIVGKVAADIARERLAPAYRKAKSDSELLESQGEKERAKLVRDQYMTEHFLPAVEALVMFSSPDEVLNSKPALTLMDKYVLNRAGGSGYTAAYLKRAYDRFLGNSRDLSDPTVKQAVIRVCTLADNGNNRAAFGVAKQMKKKIDDGEHIASDADYDLLSRVAVFY